MNCIHDFRHCLWQVKVKANEWTRVRHSDRTRKLNWWVLGMWVCHIETHIHTSACVAMTFTDKRAKPLMSCSTMKAFITTVTSVILLTYHRPNANISRHVVVFSGWKRLFKTKTCKRICMKWNYLATGWNSWNSKIWLFSWLKAEKTKM